MTAGEATAARSAYSVDSALNLTAGLEGRYRLFGSSFVSVGLRYTKFDETISDSPIVDNDDRVLATFGYLYNF